MAKADQLTLNMRIRTVAEWILEGYATKDIIQSCESKWGVDERMAYKYRKAAFKIFQETTKGKLDERLAFHVAARMKIFNALKDKNTPKGSDSALRILDSIARLEGVMVDKVDVTSKGKQIKPELNVKVYNANLTL